MRGLRKTWANQPGTMGSRFVGAHPADAVLLDDPRLVEALRPWCGVFRPGPAGGRVDYSTPPGPEDQVVIDVERALVGLLSLLARSSAAGPPALPTLPPLDLATLPKSRALTCNGERVRFLVMAGEQAATFPNGRAMFLDAVPARLAAVRGLDGRDALVEPPGRTWRVDTLACHVASAGLEWFLLLGEPSRVTTRAAVDALLNPRPPAAARGELIPVARIVTRHDLPNITAVERL